VFAERQTGQAGGRGASQKNLIRASFMQWLARSAYGGSAGRRAIRSSARYVIGRSFNEADSRATLTNEVFAFRLKSAAAKLVGRLSVCHSPRIDNRIPCDAENAVASCCCSRHSRLLIARRIAMTPVSSGKELWLNYASESLSVKVSSVSRDCFKLHIKKISGKYCEMHV